MATNIAGLSAGHRFRAFLVLTLSALGLTACGGGGGGGSPPPPPPPPPSVAFSTTNITFNATSPWSARPANQILTGTVTGAISGTLFIIVEVNNPEIAGAQNVTVISETQGQGIIVPVLPSTLGSGTHTGTLTVRVCLNSPTCATGNLAGSPRTINLTYNVPYAVERDTVTPYVINTGFTGQVILRGAGFAANTTVSFGGTPAAVVQFVSSTELRVTPPVLTAGTHAVQLNGGALAFSGSLVVVAPTAFPAAFLPHSANPWYAASLEYDAGRRALLLSGANANAPELKRYEFVGSGWAAPVLAAGPLPTAGFRQIRMSHDGSTLLALTSSNLPVTTVIHEFDPVTLAALTSTTLDSQLAISQNISVSYGETFALANDGSLLLQARLPGSGSAYPIRFDTQDRVFTHLIVLSDTQATSVGAGNGSFVLMISGLSQPAIRYDSSIARVTRATGSPPLNTGFNGPPPSASLTGAVIQSGIGIANANFLELGRANNNTFPVAGIVNRAGTRFHVFESDGVTARLRTYDISGAPPGSGAIYPEVGSPITLAGIPGGGSSTRMAITPDGGTVFIVGGSGIAIQPTPP